MVQRLPLLAPADYAVAETGGRMYVTAGSTGSDPPLDPEWTRRIEAACGTHRRAGPRALPAAFVQLPAGAPTQRGGRPRVYARWPGRLQPVDAAAPIPPSPNPPALLRAVAHVALRAVRAQAPSRPGPRGRTSRRPTCARVPCGTGSAPSRAAAWSATRALTRAASGWTPPSPCCRATRATATATRCRPHRPCCKRPCWQVALRPGGLRGVHRRPPPAARRAVVATAANRHACRNTTRVVRV